MKWFLGTVGVIGVLLGGLWLLQGTGLVVIEPIACVGECEPLEGPSVPWAVAGLALVLAGCAALWLAWKRR